MNENEIILIIDDELQIRRLLEITLSANGYQYHPVGKRERGADRCGHAPSFRYYPRSGTAGYRWPGNIEKTQRMVF